MEIIIVFLLLAAGALVFRAMGDSSNEESHQAGKESSKEERRDN